MSEENTATGLQSLIGREGELIIGPLGFRVRVLDARRVFNRLDLKVEPIKGSGSKWVSAESVALGVALPVTGE